MKAGVSFKEMILLEMEGWGRYEERYATETDFLARDFPFCICRMMRKTHSIPAVYQKNEEDGNSVWSHFNKFLPCITCNSSCNFHPTSFILVFIIYHVHQL
jgi:hypothetical protein